MVRLHLLKDLNAVCPRLGVDHGMVIGTEQNQIWVFGTFGSSQTDGAPRAFTTRSDDVSDNAGNRRIVGCRPILDQALRAAAERAKVP